MLHYGPFWLESWSDLALWGLKVAMEKSLFVVLLPAGESQLQAKGTQKVGWGHDGLSQKGVDQAKKAGQMMAQAGFQFDAVFTSMQKQAIYTAWTALMEGEELAIPHYQSYRLNDRHWGKLQGRSEKELEQTYDKDHLHNWIKDAPPAVEHCDVQHPVQDPLYRAVPRSLQPGTESIKMVFNRVQPLLSDHITPLLQAGKNMLIVGHEASVNAMCQLLEGDEDDEEEDFGHGEPWVLELDEELFVRKKMVLNDGYVRRLAFRFSETAGDLVPIKAVKPPADVGSAGNTGGSGQVEVQPAPVKLKEEYNVEVKIVQAKNLRDADWMTGTSDPYCVCRPNGKEEGSFATKTISNARDTVKWSHVATTRIKRGATLDFTIRDEDWGKKDDHLGSCSLKFEDILENFQGKMALLDEKGKVLPGKTGKGAFLTVAVKIVD